MTKEIRIPNLENVGMPVLDRLGIRASSFIRHSEIRHSSFP